MSLEQLKHTAAVAVAAVEEARRALRLAEDISMKAHYALQAAERQEKAEAALAGAIRPEVIDIARFANARLNAVKALRDNRRLSNARFILRCALELGGLPKEQPEWNLLCAAKRVLAEDHTDMSMSMRGRSWALHALLRAELDNADPMLKSVR